MFELLDCVLTQDYLTENEILNNGSWKKFRNAVKESEVYLFGTGKACKFFLDNWKDKIPVQGVFDNSPTKLGGNFEGYKILNPKEIRTKENIVILITTTSYMDDIATQLENMDFHNYFGLAVLEAKRISYRVVAAVANFVLWKVLPVKKNRILISNSFRKYNDSAKAIVDMLLAEKVNCEILWMNPHPESEYPKEIKLIGNDVFSKIIAHSTSKVWVDSFKKELWIRKKKNQKYINTWHGCVSLKKLDYDQYSSSDRHLKRTSYDSKLIDVRISNSEFCTEMYRRAMRYEGEVLKCGTPRLDQCFGKGTALNVRKTLGISEVSKIVLYAPTWRMATKTGFPGVNNAALNFENIRKSFQNKLGEEVYFLIKMHPAAPKMNIEKSDYIKEITEWENVYELLMESDILISDYSSLVFEMGFLGKPVFLFVNDYEQYKTEHGVYLELEEMPYPHAFTQEELECRIDEFNREDYEKKLRWFNEEKLQIAENGTATKQVVDRILRCLGE